MGMPKHEMPTMPPSKADEAAAEFETYIAERGENQARWVRLMGLLAETFPGVAAGAQSEAA
jgi:hypothetical protein